MRNRRLFHSDTMERQSRSHYTDYSLKLLAQTVGLSIRRIKLRPFTKDFGYNSGIESVDTLLADISMFTSSAGILSYVEILPHYLPSAEEMAKAPLICEDLVVRFSIYPEGDGFFTPTWIQAIGKDFIVRPSGVRMDWDKMTNQTYRRTGILSQKWLIPGMTFDDATATDEGNYEAVKEMLQLWFFSGIKH